MLILLKRGDYMDDIITVVIGVLIALVIFCICG